MVVRLSVGSTVGNTITVFPVLLGSAFRPADARGIEIGYRDFHVRELLDGDPTSKTYASLQRRSSVCLAVHHRRSRDHSTQCTSDQRRQPEVMVPGLAAGSPVVPHGDTANGPFPPDSVVIR